MGLLLQVRTTSRTRSSRSRRQLRQERALNSSRINRFERRLGKSNSSPGMLFPYLRVILTTVYRRTPGQVNINDSDDSDDSDDSECFIPGAWIEQPLILPATPGSLPQPSTNGEASTGEYLHIFHRISCLWCLIVVNTFSSSV